MSLFNTMQTSVSGMAAQASALSTIGDNIANSATTGYKDAAAQFQTILGQNTPGSYESGGVLTDVRYGVADQGTLTTTTSPTDLAVNGNGFFVVSQNGQGTYMTRAGSFVPDSNGDLVNAAGYQLMGYAIQPDGTSSTTLSPVNVGSGSLQYAVSTTGTLAGNLPSTAAAISSGTPGTSNTSGTQYTDKTSLTVYDSLGTPDVLDVYMTKTGTNTWEATAYQQSQESASGGFPYSGASVGSVDMNFNASTGALTGTTVTGTSTATATAKSLTVTMPSGATVAVGLSGMTQLATSFGMTAASANGNSPSKVSSVSVGKDGTLSEVYASGAQVNTYKIPLATVSSPDNLTNLSGNVYTASASSGQMIISAANSSGTGAIDADTLEQSTVDLATELTNMIQAQRSYEANSKVLQAGSDLLGVLNRLSTS